MSVLIGKMIALGLDDLAIKELRILKRRLDPGVSKMKAGTAATAPQTLDELLDFGEGCTTGAKISLIVTTQLQVLRLLASSRNHRQVEAALSFLQPTYPSSPTSLLLQAGKIFSKPDKFIRQLQSLSEILLSLTPSISISDDAIALEPRLSVAPEVALQSQILALHNRSLWWKLASHKGDSAKELFEPFLRCLSAFARRTQSDALDSYRISSGAFLYLKSILSDLGEVEQGPNSTLVGIYRILGTLAHEANRIDEAINWTLEIRALLDSKTDSEVKRCCVEARLACLVLRRSPKQPLDEEVLLGLLQGLERPFKGESSEIDDLLTEVSAARRAAIIVLANRDSNQNQVDMTEGMREMCESLVLLCPRLCLRYLGNAPNPDCATKELVRYEQRRQFIKKSGHNAIDSVLFLIKTLMAGGRLLWDLMDSKLQDCLLLLDRLDAIANETTPASTPSPQSYYVKISNLYYSQYLNMRRDSDSSKVGQQLRVLRRSIDCISTKSQPEKKAALFSLKLERIAEMYRILGRFDELFKTLLALRDEMIENGVLKTVTAAATTMPIKTAWIQNDEVSTLGRTMRSLIKVQFKCAAPSYFTKLIEGDWTVDERATMLEEYLEILSLQSNITNATLIFRAKIFRELLNIYSQSEYPLRRLRVLVRLLSLDVESRQGVAGDIATELDALRIEDLEIERSKDAGLRDYLVHLRTLATSLLQMQQDRPNIDVLKQGLIVWSSVRGACGDLRALERMVEDVPSLLAHLQSVADYMQVKGLECIRLASLRLIADLNELRSESPNDQVLSFTRLCSQWLHLGYSGKAGLALDKAQTYSHHNGIRSCTLLQLHLSHSEYLLAIGNYEKSEEHFLRAQATFSAEMASESRPSATLEQKALENQLLSNAYLIHSMLALGRGFPQTALSHAKQSVRALRRSWAYVEGQQQRQSSRPASPSLPIEMDRIVDEASNMSISTVKISTPMDDQQSLFGCAFWSMLKPLFRAITYLSGLHAHHGMFQETLYYAEQAYKLVKEADSEAHTAMASGYLGNIWLKAGRYDKGSEYLMAAKQFPISADNTREKALLAYHLGNMHGMLGDRDAEVEAYDDAERTLQILMDSDFIDRMDRLLDPTAELEKSMASLTVSKTKPAANRKVGAQPKTVVKKKTTTRAKSPVEAKAPVTEECAQLISLRANILRHKAQAFGFMKKPGDALAILSETGGYVCTQMDCVEQGLAMAKQLLLQSIEQMHADPVYSVLQESTISFPSIMGLLKVERNSGDRLSVAKLSPSRRLPAAKSRRDLNRSKSPAPNCFFDKLRQAQDHLTEVHSIALTVAPVAVLHTTMALLNSVAILLSAAGQIKGKALAHPGFASCSIGMYIVCHEHPTRS